MRFAVYLFFILLFGVTGYLRERFFEHMNIILASVYRGTDEYSIVHQSPPAIMEPLLQWTYPQLYYSKYPFTLLWVLFYWLISILAIRSLTHFRPLGRYLSVGYILLLVLSALSMFAGYLIHGSLQHDEYTFSRWLLGIAQSPLICLILLASEKLNLKPTTHDQQG